MKNTNLENATLRELVSLVGGTVTGTLGEDMHTETVCPLPPYSELAAKLSPSPLAPLFTMFRDTYRTPTRG